MKIRHLRVWTIYAIVCCSVFLCFLWLRARFREPPNYTLIDDRIYVGAHVADPPSDADAVLNLSLIPDTYRAPIHRSEPIRDAAPAPNLFWLRQIVDWIDCKRRHGHTVYVHCRNGVSRSGMVVVAYLMYKKEWSRDKTLSHVRAKRPQLRPNPAFMRLLVDWEQKLKGRTID